VCLCSDKSAKKQQQNGAIPGYRKLMSNPQNELLRFYLEARCFPEKCKKTTQQQE